MTSPRAGRCRALHLSDGTPCKESAKSITQVFCTFHFKQRNDHYQGYKECNGQLHRLLVSAPRYLAELQTPLQHEFFSDVADEKECKDIGDYLSQQAGLLEREIRTRKLHHSSFYPGRNNEGHAHYLKQLESQHLSVWRAIERISDRTAEIMSTETSIFGAGFSYITISRTMPLQAKQSHIKLEPATTEGSSNQNGILNVLLKVGWRLALVLAVAWALQRPSWRTEIKILKNIYDKVDKFLEMMV